MQIITPNMLDPNDFVERDIVLGYEAVRNRFNSDLVIARLEQFHANYDTYTATVTFPRHSDGSVVIVPALYVLEIASHFGGTLP